MRGAALRPLPADGKTWGPRLAGLAQHVPAFCSCLGKLGVEFSGSDGIGEGVKDRRERRKLTHCNGVFSAGKLDGLGSVAQCEEGLTAGIDEPASAEALRRFDLDTLALGVLAPNDMGRGIVLPSKLGLG